MSQPEILTFSISTLFEIRFCLKFARLIQGKGTIFRNIQNTDNTDKIILP